MFSFAVIVPEPPVVAAGVHPVCVPVADAVLFVWVVVRPGEIVADPFKCAQLCDTVTATPGDAVMTPAPSAVAKDRQPRASVRFMYFPRSVGGWRSVVAGPPIGSDQHASGTIDWAIRTAGLRYPSHS